MKVKVSNNKIPAFILDCQTGAGQPLRFRVKPKCGVMKPADAFQMAPFGSDEGFFPPSHLEFTSDMIRIAQALFHFNAAL